MEAGLVHFASLEVSLVVLLFPGMIVARLVDHRGGENVHGMTWRVDFVRCEWLALVCLGEGDADSNIAHCLGIEHFARFRLRRRSK